MNYFLSNNFQTAVYLKQADMPTIMAYFVIFMWYKYPVAMFVLLLYSTKLWQ